MILTIIIFLLVLSLLVFVHEFGHYYTARKLGVKAEEFGLGFPPRIFGFYRDSYRRWRLVRGNKSIEELKKDEKKAPADTIYSLNWVFFGGFVKIKGENGEGKDDKDSFASKSAWKKALILVAGVFMNVVLAWILFSLGFMIGMPGDLEMAGKRAKISEPQVMISSVLKDSPADKVELKMGDLVLEIESNKVESSEEMQKLIANRADLETRILIGNIEEEDKELIIIPEYNEDLNRATIGVAIFDTATISYPLFDAIWQGAKNTVFYLKLIVLAFYNLFADLIIGESVKDQVGGPVAIAKYTGEVARFGFVYLLQFIALLSLNLAIINILPIPALDGGRLLFLLIEKIKGKPMKQEIEAVIHTVFFFLLIALIIFVTYRDIINLI
jgi:regulator of sigma E protease